MFSPVARVPLPIYSMKTRLLPVYYSTAPPRHQPTECVCQVCSLYPRVSQSWDCSLSCYNLLSQINSNFASFYNTDSDKYLLLQYKTVFNNFSRFSSNLSPRQQIPPLHVTEIVQWKGESQTTGSSDVTGVARTKGTASGTSAPDYASRLTPEAFSITGYSHKAVEV